jgi:hypothetical protein
MASKGTRPMQKASHVLTSLSYQLTTDGASKETYGEGRRLEDRLFLRTEAVMLAVVPALADDAM